MIHDLDSAIQRLFSYSNKYNLKTNIFFTYSHTVELSISGTFTLVYHHMCAHHSSFFCNKKIVDIEFFTNNNNNIHVIKLKISIKTLYINTYNLNNNNQK